MNFKRGILTAALICAIVGALAFVVGVRVGQKSMFAVINVQLNDTQAELALNRLDDERHWKELLSKGCVAQTAKSIDIAEDMDMRLLAEFIHGEIDAPTLKYISVHDPGFIQQLNTFKSKYGGGWFEGSCNG
jgi:hypothetical protein